MAAATFTQNTVGGLTTYVVSTTGQVNLGNADPRVVSSWLVGFIKGGATISVTPTQKLHNSAVSDANAFDADYYDQSDKETVVAAGTAITDDAIIKVITDGMDLILDVTTLSGGTLTIEAVPLRG